MEGKNKQIEQEKPTSSASAFPKIPILAASGNTARPSIFMSPSSLRLPRSPTSFNYFGPKPYFMNKTAAGATTPGASSSGTTPAAGSFFPRSESLIMRGEQDKMDQNPLPPSSQNLTFGNSAKTEVAIPVKGRGGRKPDPNMESRKLKRIMSNRLSAQRSRIRKLQHLYDMEKKAESLQSLVHVLSSQVQLQKDKQFLMTIEKRQLQNRITACANRKLMVDGEIEARTEELNRLRELHMAQQNQQTQPQTMGVWEHELSTEQMMDPSLNHYVDSDQVDAGDQYMPEINMMNNLHLQQESSENNIMVPGWEAGGGQHTDVGLGQSGVEQLQTPYLNQQPQQQNQIGSFNSGMGELEQIFNFNPQNGVNPSNGFI